MRKSFTILLIVITSLSVEAQKTPSVLYGERDISKDSVNMYIDKSGTIYPSLRIPDREMEAANSSLKEWYKVNESKFLQIAKDYGCLFDSFSENNILSLNDSIIATYARSLNSSSNASVTFLVHGFRKPFVSVNGDTNSQEDFETLKRSFIKYNHSDSKIIQVYWDALYGCCFSANQRKNEKLFELFDSAQENAERVGFTLKKILNQSSKATINIVTHSLGARVAMYSVLNINNEASTTPSNSRINLCLIAPAISSELVSDNYMKRNSSVDLMKLDNYHLYVVYNEKDFVLKKKDPIVGWFGPGPDEYGNTRLGCNYKNAALNLQKKFLADFKLSQIRLYNMSFIGKCHLMTCYCYADNLEDVFRDFDK